MNVLTNREVAYHDLQGTLQSGVVRARSVVLLMAGPGGELWTARLLRGEKNCTVQATTPPLPTPEPPVAPQWGPRWQPVKGRRFEPLSAGAPFHRMFTLRDAQYVVSFRDAVLTLFLLPSDANASALPALRLPAARLGIDEVRDAALWCPHAPRYPCASRDDVVAVLLAGAWRGEWQVVAVATPATGAFYSLRDNMTMPRCTRDKPCRAVGCLALAPANRTGDNRSAAALNASDGGALPRTILYLVLEQDHGLLTAKLALGPAYGAVPQVLLSVTLEGASTGTAALAVVHDAPTAAVFVGTQGAQAPSIIYKLRDASLKPYGVVRLGVRAGHPEVGRFLLHAPQVPACAGACARAGLQDPTPFFSPPLRTAPGIAWLPSKCRHFPSNCVSYPSTAVGPPVTAVGCPPGRARVCVSVCVKALGAPAKGYALTCCAAAGCCGVSGCAGVWGVAQRLRCVVGAHVVSVIGPLARRPTPQKKLAMSVRRHTEGAR